jgi:hypothetical protein
VLGARADVTLFKEEPGMNVLDLEPNSGYSVRKNIRWLDGAMRRGDNIEIVTDVDAHLSNVARAGKHSKVAYEIRYVEEMAERYGYERSGSTWSKRKP